MLSKIFYILLISMVPVIELRGAIPAGTAMGVPWYYCALTATLGNLLPVPFILLFIEKIFAFMKKKGIFPGLIRRLEAKAEKGAKKIKNNASKIGKNAETHAISQEISDIEAACKPTDSACECADQSSPDGETEANSEQMGHSSRGIGAYLALAAFVAIPLPGTGAWSGSLVAGLFRMNRKKAFLSVVLGVIIAAAVVTLISYGILGFLNFLI